MQFTLPPFIKINIFHMVFILLSAFLLLPQEVFAGSTGGGLPYESWLEDLRDSVSGPVALTAALIGTVGAATALIFGGDEMKGATKTLFYLVLVISLIIGANDLIMMYSGSGAEFSINHDNESANYSFVYDKILLLFMLAGSLLLSGNKFIKRYSNHGKKFMESFIFVSHIKVK